MGALPPATAPKTQLAKNVYLFGSIKRAAKSDLAFSGNVELENIKKKDKLFSTNVHALKTLVTLAGPKRAEVRDSEHWPGRGGKNPPLLCRRQGAVLSLK